MLSYFKNRNNVLGMNSRNLLYVRPYNRKISRRLADDKIHSKRVLKKNGIPVPAIIDKIISHEALEKFDWNSLPNSFVLKPNRGFGGEGIVVLYGRKKNCSDTWIKADGSVVTIEDLKTHVQNILDGTYSLSNTPDTAFFEERMKLLKLFKPYVYKGIPDIRVLVFNKVPIMAMLRLPTKESGGKANLQQGAIGLGIDLASGTTTTAVQGKAKMIEYLPGSRLLLSGLKIPYWKDILRMAVRCQEISKLGYLGADIAIDGDKGPVVVELNARPGLSIQVANLAGLAERLRRVVGLKIKTLEKGVRMGSDLFGGEIEEELEDISGKKVIGTVEKVKLIGKDGKEMEVEARVDTGAGISSIDKNLARELGYGQAVDYWEEFHLDRVLVEEEIKKLSEDKTWLELEKHPDIVGVAKIFSSHGATYRIEIKISIIIDNQEVTSKLSIANREGLKYPILVGRRDLKKFLIDISK
jgi:alpha-L-glutamate ligase-like protein